MISGNTIRTIARKRLRPSAIAASSKIALDGVDIALEHPRSDGQAECEVNEDQRRERVGEAEAGG